MSVDESVVAFWNWTRISLALEEEADVNELDAHFDACDDSDTIDTIIISIFVLIGAILAIYVLYR